MADGRTMLDSCQERMMALPRITDEEPCGNAYTSDDVKCVIIVCD
jgi:hypothetical protein